MNKFRRITPTIEKVQADLRVRKSYDLFRNFQIFKPIPNVIPNFDTTIIVFWIYEWLQGRAALHFREVRRGSAYVLLCKIIFNHPSMIIAGKRKNGDPAINETFSHKLVKEHSNNEVDLRG